MRRLSSPHVVQVYQVGEHDDGIYMAMEYVEGLTSTRLRRDGVQVMRDPEGEGPAEDRIRLRRPPRVHQHSALHERHLGRERRREALAAEAFVAPLVERAQAAERAQILARCAASGG